MLCMVRILFQSLGRPLESFLGLFVAKQVKKRSHSEKYE